jgi:hypothetical protein
MTHHIAAVPVQELFFGPRQVGAFDDCLIVVIPITGSAVRRLCSAFTLRLRLALASARLRSQGATKLRTFAVIPDLQTPSFVIELRTVAARYAANNLRVGHRSRQEGLRRVLADVMGCDPATGAVVLLGSRRS